MSQLALYLLGSPRIEVDGKAVKMQRRKAVALIAYLAVTGESHSREKLATLLWPEHNASSIRNNFRVALAEIRRKLGGEEWLAVDGEHVGLKQSAGLWVDVEHVHRLQAKCAEHGHLPDVVCADCLPLLDEATALYRDDFLAGFSLANSPEFDEWQFFQAEGLRQTLTDLLDRLVYGHTTESAFELAIPYARRRLSIDPLHEPAHCQLMQLYAQSGHYALAERQYQECQRILAEELSLEPQPETRALFEQFKRRALPDQERSPVPPLPSSTQLHFVEQSATSVEPEESIFVAREHELAQLDALLTAALSGQGQVSFIAGETGTGKTALIQEFARRIQDVDTTQLAEDRQGRTPIVLQGNCSAYTGIGDPYLPFREILRQLTGDVDTQRATSTIDHLQRHRLWQSMSHVIQLLLTYGPDLINTFAPGSQLVTRAASVAAGTAWLTQLENLVERQAKASERQNVQPNRQDLFEQYTQVLQRLAQQHPLLLIVEDLQWVDMGSVSLLFHLGLRLQGSRILVVGTYRPSDVALGRGGERHPLITVLNEFQRHFGQIEVDLSRTAGREFVDSLLDAEPNQLPRAFRDALYRHTQGHALFTVEILRGLQAHGGLVRDKAGRWVVGPMVDWQQLPARVEGVIAERIDRLPPMQQELLTVASVEGERFTAEVVAQVQSTGAQKIVQALSRGLERQHRLVQSEGSRRLGAQRLSVYRFQHILYQAYVYSRLDEAERAYLHEVVARALEQLYGGQMEEIAVQLAYHWQKAGITEKAINALYQAGHKAFGISAHEEAITHLSKGLALLETLPDTAARSAQKLKFQIALWTCYLLPAELSRARALGQQWLDLAQQRQDETLALLGHGALGVTLTKSGKLVVAREHLRQFMTLYDPERHHSLTNFIDLNPTVACLNYQSLILWLLGYPDQAITNIYKSLALAEKLSHPFSQAWALAWSAFLHQFRGEAEPTRKQAERLIALSTEHRFRSLSNLGAILRGWALTEQGEAAGNVQIRENINAWRGHTLQALLPNFLALLAEVHGKLGEPSAGLAVLRMAFTDVERTGERIWEAELHRLQGELLLMQTANGAHMQSSLQPEAEAAFRKAIGVARRQQAKSLELRAVTSLSRSLQQQGRENEAHTLLTEIIDWFFEGFDTTDLKTAAQVLDTFTSFQK